MSMPISQPQSNQFDQPDLISANTASLLGRPAIWTWLFRSLILTVVGWTGLLIYWGVVEWNAAKTLTRSLSEILSSTDDSQDLKNREAFLSAEKIKSETVWAKVANLSSSVEMFGFASWAIGSRSRRHFVPGSVWKEEPMVAEMLEHCRPIFELYEEAVPYPLPSFDQIPVARHYWYWRQSAWYMLQRFNGLVQLEIVHAIYHKDHVRAIRGFGKLARMIQLRTHREDPTFFFSSRSSLHFRLRESLNSADWSLEELKEIQQMMAARIDVQKEIVTIARARRLELCRRLDLCWLLKETQDGKMSLLGFLPMETTIFKLPSRRLAFLEEMNNFVERCESGEILQDYLQRFKRGPVQFETMLDYFGLNASQMAHDLVKYEDFRRLTKTALAIKQYQLEKGEWPGKLSDLLALGLEAGELKSMAGHPFGFEVGEMKSNDLALESDDEPTAKPTDESKDAGRKYAWLWLLPDSFSNTSDIDMAVRPEFQSKEFDNDCFRLVQIR